MQQKHILSSASRCHRPSFLAAAALGLWAFCSPASAQSDGIPVQRPVVIDWPAVVRDVQALSPLLLASPQGVDAKIVAEADQQVVRYTIADKEAARPLARLNAFMAPVYPGVQNVPVPVLAPFFTDRYLAQLARDGASQSPAAQSFLGGSLTRLQFLPKSTGYDAILTVSPELMRRLQLESVGLNQIHMGAAAMLYEPTRRNAGADARGAPVEDGELKALYPDLRRHVDADEVTYNFTKYGVIYFASIACQGAKWPETNIVPCARADAILKVALLDLRLIGGAPVALERRVEADIPRPAILSPSFKFVSPGKLWEGTDQDGLGGVTEKLRWGPANLPFPIKVPSAFANSQIFLHGGSCLGQKIPMANGQYRCRQNYDKILEDRENHPENYGYPWRDTYCEMRDEPGRVVNDCLAGSRAHVGQDIRPRECAFVNGRCKIDLFDVIAVTNGKAWWTAQNYIRLIAEDGTTLYYMYLHMSPAALARAGMQLGAAVSVVAGQKIGEVGNWWQTEPNGTTAHLHFEIRNMSEPCGSFGCTRAPYWTLILAYERLINLRGTEVPD